MDDNQRIEVELNPADHTPLDFFALCISVLLTYYVLDPTALERHKDFMRSAWTKLQYQVSIWQTRFAIRSLPETDL